MFDIEEPAGEKLEPGFYGSLVRFVMSFGFPAKVS